MSYLIEMIKKHKSGQSNGIYSVCSAHPLVLEAALQQGLQDDSYILIEATSNQVNQFGGYTGMKPADFKEYVFALADKAGFNRSRIILGGDHLGPNAWQKEPAAQAMAKAAEMVSEYVLAGFRKIHLDCSMSCEGDPVPLSDETVAKGRPPYVWWQKVHGKEPVVKPRCM